VAAVGEIDGCGILRSVRVELEMSYGLPGKEGAHHVVVEVVSVRPSLLSKQEPNETEDEGETDDTTDNTSGNGSDI
jgi:hypothetical protein